MPTNSAAEIKCKYVHEFAQHITNTKKVGVLSMEEARGLLDSAPVSKLSP